MPINSGFGQGNDSIQLPSASQLATGQLSFSSALATQSFNNSKVQGANFPWQKVTSNFFKQIAIDGTRWNELFPYRLIVIDSKNNNIVVNGTSSADVSVTGTQYDAIVAFEPLGYQWVFNLPISPQQFNISENFAIQTTPTLLGILEEHSGSRFKMINCAGTMGVWPYRKSVVKAPTSPTPLQSLFGGTIAAFGNVVNQITAVINTATTGTPTSKPVTPQPSFSDLSIGSTGYYQALALQQFLEQYAEAKKIPANSGWRLVFDIPKQKQSYVVTPVQYNWQQAVNSPLEFKYSFQLKAWRRIDLSEQVSFSPAPQALTPGILQRILNTIAEARIAASSILNLIGAVQSDIEAPLAALQQTSLLVKDLAGAIVTAADLPAQLQTDYANAISNFLTTVNVNNLPTSISSNPSVSSNLAAIKANSFTNEGLSMSAVSGGQIGPVASHNQAANPTQNIFTQTAANYVLFDQVPVDSLQLSNAQRNAVNNAIAAARALTVSDLMQFRQTLLQLALKLSNNFGTGDAFVSKVYNYPPPISRVTPITLDDYDILATLYQAIQSYDLMTATTQINDNNIQTNMEYVAGLADQANIEFQISNSKILAPVPFGLTIEAIAARYLGDAQRWLEIATLNNLKDPYIDEDGFQYSLLSNAIGRQIVIGSDYNLYLGQSILIQSSTQPPSARSILGIEQLSTTSFLITLDGEPNLDNFLITDGAYLQAYLPGTVNSQQKIFIPSDLVVPNDPNIIIPPIASADPLSGMSKVDLLLTDSGDLAINNYGDLRYSYGLTNIMQALKIKLGTINGTVLLHPEFGFGIRPGTMNSDIQLADLYSSINRLIADDPRFQGVNNLQISLNGPTLLISMSVTLSGNNGVFPINFTMTQATA